MPSDIVFRQLLLDLDDEMSNEERKRFVFLLADDIPKKMRDEPLVDIFTILMDRGHISKTNCSYLVVIFERMKLFTIAYKIAQFEAQHSSPIISENTQPREDARLPSLMTTENCQNHTPTVSELLNELYAEDNMILSDAESDSLVNTPNAIECVSTFIRLSVENIDLETFENESWSTEFLDKINVNHIRPYEYQRELVQSAIEAGNTIICLRTGGGKTFVAALLIKYYWIKKMTLSNSDEKQFLAFFIVPRRAMLKQQLEKLKQIGNLRVAACDEHNDVTQYTNDYNVIICTPQKLINCLKAQTIFLSNIDLLCFDECHDRVGWNQYVGIMQYLMCEKIAHIPPVEKPPVIIGLTAIGVHQSNTSLIINSLSELCATFNCSTITTVLKKENEEELERCITRVSEDEIICVDKQQDFEKLRLSIEKELKNLILQLFVSIETNPLRIFPEKDFDMNGYEQNLELLKQSEQKNQHFASVLLLDYTRVIYRHLRALNDLTPRMVLSDLKDHFEMIYKSREHPLDIDTLIYEQCQQIFKKKLTEIEESGQIISNPKLEQLVELLKKHSHNPNSRTLVLVERTFYAKKICEFLQNHSDLKNIIKPCWLISKSGINSKNPDKNQNVTLDEFRTGVYNVMISTDVVQAGLNIPRCSLVLRYDFVPDSIGTVQARVRSRTADCKYYLITTKDSPNYTKERDSRQCEENLKEVLETWKRFSLDEFQQRAIEIRNTLIIKWNDSMKASALRTNISKNTELSGCVLCRACDYWLGDLAQLRKHGDDYIINTRDFYNRIEEKLSREPQEFFKSIQIGTAICGSKNCRTQLGCIRTLKDHPQISPIYPLKCKSIKIKQINKNNGTEKIIIEKSWTKMPFHVPPLFENLPSDGNEDVFHDACDTFPSDV